ncbi:MAG: TetR/AcrR family transcriptional regulator [Blastocatellia bacterium]
MIKSEHRSRHQRGERVSKTRRGSASAEARQRTRDPKTAREALILSAESIFNGEGYFATNSNVIAKKAGYAASSFYTHFHDKLELFLTVYDRWVEGEWSAIRVAAESALRSGDFLHEAIARLTAHHRKWRNFRTNLRALAALEPSVRLAQNDQRRRQIGWLKELAAKQGWPVPSTTTGAFVLLTVERVLDAIAEDDADGLGADSEDLKRTLTEILRNVLIPKRGTKS